MHERLELRLAIVCLVALAILWFLLPFFLPGPRAQELGTAVPGASAPETVPSPAVDAAEVPTQGPEGQDLSAEHRDWLAKANLLLTDWEREYFFSLREEFRRRAFVAEFWRQRDPDPRTHMNELRRTWYDRMAEAKSTFGRIDDDRARVLATNGPPVFRCQVADMKMEIWAYDGSDRTRREFLMVFYAPVGRQGRYRIWEPQEGWPFAEHRYKLPSTNVRDYCERPQVVSAMMSISASEQVEPYFLFLNRILSPPMEPSPEWVATFEARSTRLPEEADTFDAELTLAYPGRHQQRTVLQGMVAAPVPPGERDGPRRFLLTGEIVRADELFDSFRFRFEAPPEGATDLVPLVFQRYLRPGPATLLLKVEDLDGRRFARLERTLEIPHTVEAAGTPGIEDSELFRFLAEAEAATALGERNIRLLPPDGAAVHTGKVRFDTLAVGDFERVEFSLDGQPIMTKNRPPFSVELDLGNLPGMQRLRVSALDALGTEVASDEILLNPGGQSFRVRWLEPRANRRYRGSTRAVIDVQIPDGETLDRLELFIGDHLAATLFQPPFVQPLAVPDDGLAYLRAVAHLADGHSTEDVVFINADGPVETVDVRLVEIYAGVYDRRGRPVLDLAEEDFTVTESDEPRTLQRFEHRRDLPIQTVLLIDTSASMEDSLEQVTDTARRYLDQTLRPEDRAALVAFHHQPRVESRFTNDPEVLSQALGALRAEGGTALYDSLVFALHYFHGIRGHKALLLLSDGEDESSGFDFERTLEYAQHTGVTLYTIGLAASKLDRDAKKVLRTLAEETGGRSWMVDDLAELGPIYDRIELELRSRYLLAYQASGDRDETAFRPVSVEVAGDRSLEVRAPSGYFP